MTSSVVRSCDFIDTGTHILLPRPTSVGAGMARHRWFSTWAGTRPFHIASPPVWTQAAAEHGIQTLCEHQDGTFTVRQV